MIGSQDTEVSMKFVEISTGLPEERQHGQPSDVRLETKTLKTRQGHLVDLHSNLSKWWDNAVLNHFFQSIQSEIMFSQDL